jgi:DNA-binding transcriptional LysR family regulator
MVAVVPELLARRLAATAGVTVTEPPFGTAEIAEAAWWHPRHAGPAYGWLRKIIAEAAAAQRCPAGRQRPHPADPGTRGLP